MNFTFLMKIALFSVLAISLAGCASDKPTYASARLVCTGVCSVGDQQAESRCKAQATKPYTYSTPNAYGGAANVYTTTYLYKEVFKNCMRGEGWEYFQCDSEQKSECQKIDERFVKQES